MSDTGFAMEVKPGAGPQRNTRTRDSSAPTTSSHKAGKVTIVVPAKNEAEAIRATLRAIPVATLEALGYEVETIVLDGHSNDGTPDIARAEGATVIPDESDGKGSAVRNARQGLTCNYVVMLDADGSYAADAIPRVLEPLAWGDADVVMGDRRPLPGSMSGLHKVGNALLSAGAAVLYGRRCPDLCTGLWAFRADVLLHMPLESKGFELEAELFALASRQHLRIAHIQADYLPRAGTTKLSATRDGARIGWCLVRSRFRSLPRTTRPERRPRAPATNPNTPRMVRGNGAPGGGGLGTHAVPAHLRWAEEPVPKKGRGPE